jgi:hypothetical protein
MIRDKAVQVTRVGVTGHRAIPDHAYVHVHDALTEALHMAPQSPGSIEVLSSLAVGADQLFAEIALDRGARLTVVTPAADYETTFSQEELGRFRDLLRRAHAHVVLDYARVSDEAFYAAGVYIADRCDRIVAVWDGRPARGHGGTADIVDYARGLGKPVSVIWKAGVERQ